MTEQILGSLNKTIAEKKKEKYNTALEKKIRENLGHLLPEVNVRICFFLTMSLFHNLLQPFFIPKFLEFIDRIIHIISFNCFSTKNNAKTVKFPFKSFSKTESFFVCTYSFTSVYSVRSFILIMIRLMNKIVPGKISKVNTTKLAFKQMVRHYFLHERKYTPLNCPILGQENIANYLKACQQIGFQEIECFETNDLFEGRDMISVLCRISTFHFLSLFQLFLLILTLLHSLQGIKSS